VAIQASTVYIVSFSTGGGYFGITTGFFTQGGVTNGPLQALSNSVSGGDGVYNRAGAFPDVDGEGMNYWADVAFTPASTTSSNPKVFHAASQSIAVSAFGLGPMTTGQSGRVLNSATAGPRATTPTIVLGSLSYRRPITQAATLASWLKKSSLASGSIQ
jgi:hypothetical protein